MLLNFVGVVAHDGLLYVIGGDDGSANLSLVEVNNPNTNIDELPRIDPDTQTRIETLLEAAGNILLILFLL